VTIALIVVVSFATTVGIVKIVEFVNTVLIVAVSYATFAKSA
jgi:hypothetical protein